MAIKMQTLTDTEVHSVLLNALHTAARKYEELAKIDNVDGMSGATVKDLQDTFGRQAEDCRALADRIEQALTVVLTVEG